MTREELILKLIEIYYKYYDNMPYYGNVGNFVKDMLEIVGDSNEK